MRMTNIHPCMHDRHTNTNEHIQVLGRVAGATLWLRSEGDDTHEQLRRAAARSNVR